MREELMEVLAEPGTAAPLELKVSRKTEAGIQEGELRSLTTGRTYPILGGVPRFVEKGNYAESFGRQWNRFREVQLDSVTGASYSKRRFDTEIGWTAEELRGRWVLEAGCGAGRFAEVAAARMPRLVALDFSSAVEATAETLKQFSNVDVVQGDILCPPFRAGAFDFAYSIGVAQHTPDPSAAVAGILRCVRPGGRFGLTIYARKRWTKLNAKYLLRPLTTRVSQEALLRAIEGAMPLVFPLTDRLFRLPLLGRLAQFTLPVATYVDRDDFTRDQRYREAVLDTFDMLSPRYDQPMTWGEVEHRFREIGVGSWSFRSRVPINVVGTR